MVVKSVKIPRKCPKCGSELVGQKNLCPMCSRLPQTTEKVEAAPTKKSRQDGAVPMNASSPAAERLELFVKENPFSWNRKFDVFYDSLLNTEKGDVVDYRSAVEICKRWDCIFAAIRNMLGNINEITADLMIKIMDEIPQKFPEIEDMKARTLAKEFLSLAVPQTDKFSILFMPENGRLSKFKSQKQYKQEDTVFTYIPQESNPGVHRIKVPFDCTVCLITQEREKYLKKGTPIVVLQRT